MQPTIEVRFDSGQEVLSSYWGYLANGGLIIANDDAIEVGGTVSLEVVIASAGAKYQLDGKILQRHPDGHRMVVAFEPDQPHDMLLTEALAETENTPARRYRRYRIDVQGEASGCPARIVNVSKGGICLTFDREAPASIGEMLVVGVAGRSYAGRVMWLSRRELGIEFEAERADILDLVESYLEGLRA